MTPGAGTGEAVQRVGGAGRRYELVPGWGNLPEGWVLGQTGVAVDSSDNVFLFNRSEHPVIVLDRDGRFLDSWGAHEATSAHGIFVDAADHVYLPVINRHAVLEYDGSGRLLQVFGQPDVASDPEWSGDYAAVLSAPVRAAYGPFTLPTDVGVGPDGTVYCSDGYGNACVHRFTPDGTLIGSWGRPGTDGEGAFHIPHGIWVHTDGRVLVADRENNRIQVFSPTGDFLEEWGGFHSPCDIFVDADDIVYVAEGASSFWSRNAPEPSAFVCVLDLDGEVLARWSGPAGAGGHAIWADSEGSLYVNQNLEGARLVKYRRTE